MAQNVVGAGTDEGVPIMIGEVTEATMAITITMAVKDIMVRISFPYANIYPLNLNWILP